MGRVALAQQGFMTKLWLDIVTEQEHSLALSAKAFHTITKAQQSVAVLLRFGQEDSSQNLLETSLSLWLSESSCYPNNSLNCC